jgi:succinate dehydrogenase / fumarate reductase flavoprotein subunit
MQKLISVKGNTSVDTFHKRLGKIMWEYVGMARNNEGLKKAIKMIQDLREEFWKDVKVTGELNDLNPELEKAARVADFLELGELMAMDALEREESCGGHFREEYQTEEGEAVRNDKDFAFVSVWEYNEKGPKLNKEELKFENVELKTRNYK